MGLVLLMIAGAFMVPVFLLFLLLRYFKLKKTAVFVFFAIPIVTLYITFRTPSEYRAQIKELCASIQPYENFTLPDKNMMKYIESDRPYLSGFKEEYKTFSSNGKPIHWDKTYEINNIVWERESKNIDENVTYSELTGYYNKEKMVVFKNYAFKSVGPFRDLAGLGRCHDFSLINNYWTKKYLYQDKRK